MFHLLGHWYCIKRNYAGKTPDGQKNETSVFQRSILRGNKLSLQNALNKVFQALDQAFSIPSVSGGLLGIGFVFPLAPEPNRFL
jgi:hypothetical protein